MSDRCAFSVGPDVPESEQVGKLWDAIFHTVSVDQDNPVEAWNKHLEVLEAKSTVLNAKKYKKLHYIAPGTDLTIESPEGHIWAQGDSINERGHSFVANMPTEEVFTAPLKTGVNGTVHSTKPLSYAGNIVNNFSLTFEEGKVVSFTAEQGYETLERLLNMDEGAVILEKWRWCRINPRSRSPTSCITIRCLMRMPPTTLHSARLCFLLEGGKDMNQEQLIQSGLNTSVTHVDFMIGSGDMDIYGVTADGKEEPVFLKGNWAF